MGTLPVFASKTGGVPDFRVRRAAVINIGCRLNQSEGDSLRCRLANQGYELADTPDAFFPNLVIVNTCCVTKEAERSSLNRIRRAAALDPKPELIVTGCMAERDPDRLGRIPGVDRVLSIAEKNRLIADLPVLPARSRAFLKVQDGCCNRCSFCVASTLRPTPRSKPADQVCREARELLSRGFHEIVLVGLNLGSYGLDSRDSLFHLLRALATDSQLSASTPSRLRLSSIEPETISGDLLELLAELSRTGELAHPRPRSPIPILCPHFHIPLQSADDRLLRAMNRRHTADKYRSLVEAILERIPDASIGTDVIAGFPGEDDEAFRRTVRLIEDVPFGYLHVFSYSPRPGTAAFNLGDTVPRPVKKQRVAALRELGARKSTAYRSRFLGQIRMAVTLSDVSDDTAAASQARDMGTVPAFPPRERGTVPFLSPPTKVRIALTDNYLRVQFEDDLCLPLEGPGELAHPHPARRSQLVPVLIKRIEGGATFGSVAAR
jgi:threonylcarbamoyladenosine tRNA methylthiotransferase MtaB